MADRPVDQHDIERLLQEDLLDRLLGRYAADAPTADPRECPACPHHRAAHTSWGCEYCSCGVSIVDLTPVARCAVCRRVLPARDIVGGECGDCYTIADRLYERTVDP